MVGFGINWMHFDQMMSIVIGSLNHSPIDLVTTRERHQCIL